MQTTVAHIFERKCSNLFWSVARVVHGMLQVFLSADPSATGSADVHRLPAICIGSPEFCTWIRLKCVACKFCLVNETEKCHVHPSQLRIVLPETACADSRLLRITEVNCGSGKETSPDSACVTA